MKTIKNRRVKTLLIAFSAILFASGERAVAQSDPTLEREAGGDPGTGRPASPADSRWLPALSIQGGFFVATRSGEVDSAERGFIDGESALLHGVLGGSAELSTPRISILPTQPRFFAHADVYYSLDNKESLASEGNPGNPLLDTTTRLDNNSAIEGVLGAGTALQPQSEPLIVSGGLGLSFITEAGGRTIRIKPSLEWMYQRDEFQVSFSDVEATGPNPDAPCNPCRVVSTRAQTTKGFHGLGPGVEVEVDAGRMGDFAVSFFTQFRALRILGDRKAQLDTTGSWFTRELERIDGENVITSIDPDPSRADSTVRATYKRDPWGYFGSAGVRITWNPE